MSARAVVFGYHDVGDRCLRLLIARGIDVALVVTHEPDPNETPWFASVARAAGDHGIPVLTPAVPDEETLGRVLDEIGPAFLFSFYYRHLLPDALLKRARRGAFNMHGSLLPRYRGRAPVNWAILNGETETGATLHYMTSRADAGDIVDQLAVPILPDDDARDVMGKVAVAAQIVLARSLPALLSGDIHRRPQVHLPGQYFGRRTPEDGRIDWSWSAARVHNLVRAVAPPFPGAFTQVNGERWWIHKTRVLPKALAPAPPRLFSEHGRCFIACSDGSTLELLAGATEAGPLDLTELAARCGVHPLPLSTGR